MPAGALIIDDSESVRSHVQRVLTAHADFDTILCAADGLQGFKLLVERHEHVDLVFCDLMMPGLDGVKFLGLKSMRPELVEIPVIMLTGEEDVRAKVRLLGAGASDYLVKPFHDEELIARARIHLKIKQLQDELRDKNLRLEAINRTDELTGLTNRRHFMELAKNELSRSRRHGTPLAVVMIDADHFKSINDGLGHLAGDRVLAGIGKALQSGIRDYDIAARYGGEEFTLLLPQTSGEDARIVAERCRGTIFSTKLAYQGKAIRVTVSAGVAALPEASASSIEDLVRLADEALYRAKAGGRNRVVVWQPGS
jgi:two-component system cell cycle response regulator